MQGGVASSPMSQIMGTEYWEGPPDQHRQVLFQELKAVQMQSFQMKVAD